MSDKKTYNGVTKAELLEFVDAVRNYSGDKFDEKSPTYDKLCNIASGLFIDSNVQPNFVASNKLHEMVGWGHISSEDSDSFGWLVGRVHTPKGIVYFG